MTELAQWLADTSLSHAIQEALWLIPLLQSIHILAIAMVMSSVAMLDLRLVGIGTAGTMMEAGRRFLPWIWVGFVLLLATGILQMVAEPKRTLDHNPAFQLKVLLLLIGFVSVFLFQSSLRRHVEFWEAPRHRGGKIAIALFSFLLWCLILFAGRWIAYVRVE
jgi:hypothetical protein